MSQFPNLGFANLIDSFYVSKKHSKAAEDDWSSSSVDFEEYIHANRPIRLRSNATHDHLPTGPSLSQHRQDALENWMSTHNMGFCNDTDRLLQLYMVNDKEGGACKLPTKLAMQMDKILNTEDSRTILELGFRRSRANLLKKLNIIRHCFECKYNEAKLKELLPCAPFSWTKSGFMERANLPNTIWLDVLLKDFSPKCLQSIKFKCDVATIVQILDLIYKMLSDESHNEEVKTFLNDCAAFEILGFKIKQNYDKCVEDFEFGLMNKMSESLRRRNSQYDSELLDDIASSADVYDPIVSRYRVNWFRSRCEQTKMKITNVVKDLQEKIQYYKDHLEMEAYVSSCITNAYYSEAEKLRARINDFQDLFDQRLEEWDDIIIKKKHAIKKLVDKKKFLQSEIDRFHLEIEERLAWEEAQKLREQQQEEARLAELAAQSKKKKGKGKGKDKKK